MGVPEPGPSYLVEGSKSLDHDNQPRSASKKRLVREQTTTALRRFTAGKSSMRNRGASGFGGAGASPGTPEDRRGKFPRFSFGEKGVLQDNRRKAFGKSWTANLRQRVKRHVYMGCEVEEGNTKKKYYQTQGGCHLAKAEMEEEKQTVPVSPHN